MTARFALAVVLAAALQLAACGGGSSALPSGTATAVAAKGIATPASVSVVSAK